jgi:hypothetical protein
VDVLTFLECDIDEWPIDHGLNGHRLKRLHRAETIQPHRHVAFYRHRLHHRDDLIGLAQQRRFIW